MDEKWAPKAVSEFLKPAPGKRISVFFRKCNLMTHNIAFLSQNDKTDAFCSLCSDITISCCLSHLVSLLNYREILLVCNATDSCPVSQNFMKEGKKGSNIFMKKQRLAKLEIIN